MNARNELLVKSSLLRTAWLSMKIYHSELWRDAGYIGGVCLPLDAIAKAAGSKFDELLNRTNVPQELHRSFQLSSAHLQI